MRVTRLVAGAHDVALRLPVGRWRPFEESVGGEIESDAGVPASFVVQRLYSLIVPLRFFEEEWPVLQDLLVHAQSGAEVSVQLDTGEVAVPVYLHWPRPGDVMDPVPDGSYPAVAALEVALRRTDGQPWDVPYFVEEGED